MEENRIPKKVLSMNLETTRLRGRLRNRWQDEVRKDGRLVGGIGWRKRVHNREEWTKLLRMARNHRIRHMPVNECLFISVIFGIRNVCMYFSKCKFVPFHAVQKIFMEYKTYTLKINLRRRCR